MRRDLMISTLAIGAWLALYSGCVLSEKRQDLDKEPIPSSTDSATKTESVGDPLDRYLANVPGPAQERDYILFYTADPARFIASQRVEVFTPLRWARLKQGPAARRQAILDFYFSNSREDVNRINAACFVGQADDIVRDFLRAQPVADLQDLDFTTSSDNLMIGIQFRARRNDRMRLFHFRLPSCLHAGKNFFFDPRLMAGAINEQDRADERARRQPNGSTETASEPSLFESTDDAAFREALSRLPASVESEGFAVNDNVRRTAPGVDPRDADARQLPRFQLKADYHRALQINEPLPWLQRRYNLSNERDAVEFALLLKRYVYDGLVNQSPIPSQNLIAARSEALVNRYWCHMPWLNQGANGREAIHGLTQERPLAPSAMYPRATPGSNWGVAVFNFIGCRSVGQVFGTPANPQRLPSTPQEWGRAARFNDGTVTAKFLFTTANFPEIANAWRIVANVSPPNSSSRALNYVRHVQLDIAIKDSRLAGVPLSADNWIMLTYYYDESYDSQREFGLADGLPPTMPDAIRKMRPAGLQWGFGPGDSLKFRGALFNSITPNGAQNGPWLNGPADNPASNCLACHATAGTSRRMAPGIRSAQEWQSERAAGTTLDMGQQFAFAKRNYETRIKNGPRR